MTGPTTDRWDVVVVGSGINSLVCAALLAMRGKRVLVLERNDVAGGCIRTEALTARGFHHDTLSTLYPLFVTAPHFPMLEPALAAAGARFVNGEAPTAVLLPDGRSQIFYRDRDRNAAALEAQAQGDGSAYRRAMNAIEAGAELTFGLLGSELWTRNAATLVAKQGWRRGRRATSRYLREGFESCRAWLETDFQSEVARALFAPWVLHVGLSPESALSGQMGKLIMFTLEQAGSPMVEGGSSRLVEAFQRVIEATGGAICTGAHVAGVEVADGRATGVRLAAGERIEARDAVVANVTPDQLYGQLLRSVPIDPVCREDAARYRYGRGEMQIHLALDAVPAWPDPELAKVGMLHLTPGLNGVSRAVNEAERGLLPAEATIVVAQPMAIDPSRGPPGKWIFWIQLQELPRDGELKGDALGEIDIPRDGRWAPEIREAYADRIVARLCAQIPNLRRSIIGQHAISPADLAALNVNLVGGDPYSGACSIDQFMLWRPSPEGRNHDTPIRRLYHIGASTHPGPGLGGMSGFMTAQRIR